MSFEPYGEPLLTEAGKAALDEYLAAQRVLIIAEAERLSNGGPLSSLDIINAMDALSVRQNPELRSSVRSIDRTRLTAMLAGLGVVSLIGIALIAYSLIRLGSSTANQIDGAFVVAMTSLVGGVSLALLSYGVRLIRQTGRAYRDKIIVADLGPSSAGKVRVFVSHSGLQEWPAGLDRSAMSFVAKWIDLERDLRSLGNRELAIPDADAQRYPIGLLLKKLVQHGTISEAQYATIRQIHEVRNDLLHGVSEVNTNQALAALEGISDELRAAGHATTA